MVSEKFLLPKDFFKENLKARGYFINNAHSKWKKNHLIAFDYFFRF